MGQKVTIELQGTLRCSVDGIPSNRPFEVDMSFEPDLEDLMEMGEIKMGADPSRVELRLSGVVLRLMLDADQVLSGARRALVTGVEGL